MSATPVFAKVPLTDLPISSPDTSVFGSYQSYFAMTWNGVVEMPCIKYMYAPSKFLTYRLDVTGREALVEELLTPGCSPVMYSALIVVIPAAQSIENCP